MHDVLISRTLEVAGLPPIAAVQAALTGSAPGVDPYAAPQSALTDLSGYGQLLSASSRAMEGIEALTGENANYATSSHASVVTASANANATAGSYTIEVTQIAKAQISTSTAVFADTTSDVFAPGSFSIANEEGESFAVSVAGSSLDDLVSAINAAGAGVTATAQNGAFGYSLAVTGNASGANQGFSFSAPTGDPFNQWGSFLSQLGMTETQSAQDAAYTVNSGGGPVAATSATNTGIALAGDATFNIMQTTAVSGPVTVTISDSPTVGTTLAEITAAATKLVQQYNALQGTAAGLTAVNGALEADALALNFEQDLYQKTQDVYAANPAPFTTLAQIGITGSGQGNPLVFNTATLTDLFDDAPGNPASIASLLTTVANEVHTLISSYAGNSGLILSQAVSVETGMSFMNGKTADDPANANVSGQIKQYLLERALASADSPPALPSVNVFA
jgi:flagellar hook-associated protein 2